jgi:iron complex outermembrane receptor protein
MTPRARHHALHHVHSATAVAVALLLSTGLGSGLARAQTALDEVTVTAQPPLGISGFDDVPIHALPLSVSTFSQADLRDVGAQRISDVLLLDASVSESYNLPAYWDHLNVRGFALDNRYNFRRDGLPISAQTIIGLENKERLELLKGTSGMQAGTSAPGGLVNYVVKRPPMRDDQSIRNVTLSYGPSDTRSVALDLGNRFGEHAAWGYRLNVAHTELNPYIRDTQGQRDLVALAMDWRLDARNRLEWEFEQSHVEQIGVNFYSLMGSGPNALPAPVDGTRNITRQPNSRPGVFDGLTGSVRFKHQLDQNWLWTTHYGVQRLRADDRLVYAAGCSETMTDRFCTNGDFQIYDYNTDNERRNNEVAQTSLSGQTYLGGLEHGLTVSVMRQRLVDDMPRLQTSPLLGTTNSITGGLTPPSQASDRNGLMSNTRDASTEWAVKDRVKLKDRTTAWLGLRYTQLNRQSAMTDGSGATQDQRNFMTPWLAVSHALDAGPMVFASAGQGIESEVAPNDTTRYSNAGQALPTLRSHQHEMGIKSASSLTRWQATWFDITRPVSGDSWGCSNGGACTRQMDGQAHHRGLELNARTTQQGWTWDGSATWLRARRENAISDPSLNGQRPINVPSYIVRGLAEYRFASITGLRTGLRLSREGKRHVTEHGEIVLPAWTTLDLTTHYDSHIAQHEATWTWGIQNVANKHYWRESPKQYGQYFLNPGAPRTFRASVQWHL